MRLTKENLGWPIQPPFCIPEPVRAHFLQAVERGRRAEAAWNDKFFAYAQAFPELARELQQFTRGELPAAWDADTPRLPAAICISAYASALGSIMNGLAALMGFHVIYVFTHDGVAVPLEDAHILWQR